MQLEMAQSRTLTSPFVDVGNPMSSQLVNWDSCCSDVYGTNPRRRGAPSLKIKSYVSTKQ
jgi:hypothetical protein